MQRTQFARARRHGFQAARRKTGERSRRPRRDCQWTPSQGDHARNGTQARNVLSAEQCSAKAEELMATIPTTAASNQQRLLRARAASAKLALLSTGEKNAMLLAIASAIEGHEKSILAAN